MKKNLFLTTMLLTIVAAMMTVMSCGPKKEAQKEEVAKKMLVLYYSQTSNTKTVAQEIATRLGADIEEIIPVKPYDGDFQATIGRCNEEREQGITTEIKPIAANLDDYDIIFIGYPVWFGTFAPPVATFLDQANLSEKTLVPFCTFGSGGLESSAKDLAEKQPQAKILPGYGVRAARMDAVSQEVEQFLKAGGFLEGEPIKLEAFSEQQPVSEAETAIFDAAVGDYPMIHAQAKTVASRPIPDGVEYLFTAADLPREDAQPAPAPNEMQIYVIALEGKTPVFTRVVR